MTIKLDGNITDFISNYTHLGLELSEGVLKASSNTDLKINHFVLASLKEQAKNGCERSSEVIEAIHLKQRASLHAIETIIPSTSPQALSEILNEWCDEAIGTAEYANRCIALRKIERAYQEKREVLALPNLQLSSIPNCFSFFSDLKELHLPENNLRELPSSLSTLTQLEGLYLNHNQFTSFFDTSFEYPRLKYLYLQDNKIQTLGDKAHLPQLEILRLDGNALSHLDSFPLASPNLKFLYLQRNRLESIGPWIRDLERLCVLYLNNNALSDLPSLSSLRNLETLSLAHNKLRSFPTGLEPLTKLTALNLVFNSFDTIPIEAASLSSAVKIKAAPNQLTDESIENFNQRAKELRENNPHLGPVLEAYNYNLANF